MASKLLVCVSPRQVSAALWSGGSFSGCELFAYSDGGLAAFKEYLGRLSNLPVYMLVDAVEEDYRQESLPHSFGSERTEMVNRKLKQFYRSTPYCSARLQGREEGKRRDDRYLFCALTNPELISDWVQAVMDSKLPMAGIYPVPAVAPTLVAKLQLKQTKLLMVSVDTTGLRLTFLRDQKLRISRFAHIDGSTPQAIKSYAEEISNTRLYLHALRILTLDEQLTVVIVDRNDALMELAQAISRDSPNIECRRLTRQEIISHLRMTQHALDSSSNALALHLLGLSAPENNLAPPNVTVGFRQHQTRRGIYALAGVVAFAALAWCGFNWFQILDVNSEIDAAKRETTQLQAQYAEATRRFPAAPTTADNLKRAVEISQKIGSTTRSPEGMLNVVSQAVELNPSITVKAFGWKYDRSEIEADTKAASVVGDKAVPGPVGESRKQSGLIEGEVRPFRGDYRAAIETINRFADTLLKQPGVAEVKLVKLPLNINPSLTLSGNTADSREQAGTAEFKLVPVLKSS